MGSGWRIHTAGPRQNQTPTAQAVFLLGRLGGNTVPSSLDSSLEKTILGFFFVSRCWVFGCRWVVRRGSGVTKSLSEVAEARCWCLETRKGRGLSPKDKKEPSSERRASLVSPLWGCLTYPRFVFWLMGFSGYPLGQSPLLHPTLSCDRPEASAQIHLL